MFIQRRKIEHVLDEFQRGNLSNSKGVYENKYTSPTIHVFNTTSHILHQGDFAYITGISGVGSALEMAQDWMNGSMVFDVCDEDHTVFDKPDSLEGGLILAKDGYYKNDSDNASIVVIAEDIDPSESGQAYVDNLYATFAVCWERETDECMPKNCYTNKPLFVEQYNVDSRWAIYCGDSYGANTIRLYPYVEGCAEWHEHSEGTHYARFCLNGEYVVAMSEYDDYSMSGNLESPTVYERDLLAVDRKMVFVVCRKKEHSITKNNSLMREATKGVNPFGGHPRPNPLYATGQMYCSPFFTDDDETTLGTIVYHTLAINSEGQSYILPFSLVNNRFLPKATWNLDGSVVDSFDGEVIRIMYYFRSPGLEDPVITDYDTYQYAGHWHFIAQYSTFDLHLPDEWYNDIHGYCTKYGKDVVKWRHTVPSRRFDTVSKKLIVDEFTYSNVKPNYQTIKVNTGLPYSINGHSDVSVFGPNINGVTGIGDYHAGDLRYIEIISLNLATRKRYQELNASSTLQDMLGPIIGSFDFINRLILLDGSQSPVTMNIDYVNSSPEFLFSELPEYIDYTDVLPTMKYTMIFTPIPEARSWKQTTYTINGHTGTMYFPYELSLSGVRFQAAKKDVNNEWAWYDIEELEVVTNALLDVDDNLQLEKAKIRISAYGREHVWYYPLWRQWPYSE